MTALRHLATTAAVWAALWIALATIVATIIGVVDPDSLDPGETQGLLAIMGFLGLLSGIAFGVLAWFGKRRATPALPSPRVLFAGFLGTALVQLAFLNHGNGDLEANSKMALGFSVAGTVIAVAWFLLARRFVFLQRPTPAR